MLKISDSSLSRYQNEEHYKYVTDVNGLITFFTAATLMIVAEYAAFLKSYADEGEALNFVRKSTYSDQLHAADLVRNDTLDGMEDLINSGLKHFNPEVRKASAHLKVLWNNNGNIKIKSQEKKSGAIIKLVSELRGAYAADVLLLGMTDWVNVLESNNNDFDTVQKNRYNEKDDRTQLRMKLVRTEMDEAYYRIIDKINALIIVNGEAPYVDFVNKLNLRIDAYTNSLNIRKGKGKNPPAPTTDVK